jgi:hypothetical protein
MPLSFSYDSSTTYNLRVGRGTERELAAIYRRAKIGYLWCASWDCEWGTEWVTLPVRCRTDGNKGWVQGWARVQSATSGLHRPMLFVHQTRRGGRVLQQLDASKLRQWVRRGWIEPCGWLTTRSMRERWFPAETSKAGIPASVIAAYEDGHY